MARSDGYFDMGLRATRTIASASGFLYDYSLIFLSSELEIVPEVQHVWFTTSIALAMLGASPFLEIRPCFHLRQRSRYAPIEINGIPMDNED